MKPLGSHATTECTSRRQDQKFGITQKRGGTVGININIWTIALACETYFKVTDSCSILKFKSYIYIYIYFSSKLNCSWKCLIWIALSQNESTVHYIQGCTLSESINYWHAMFSGARLLGRHSEQIRGRLYASHCILHYKKCLSVPSLRWAWQRHWNEIGWQDNLQFS
jgi:hypothetical protein